MSRTLLLAALLIANATTFSQEPEVKRPKDQAVHIESNQKSAFEAMVAPCIAIARKTLPDAKKRYASGLRKNEIFYITLRLYDPNGKYEAVFLKVQSWTGTTIQGFIDSDIELISAHKRFDHLTVNEADAIDWTFSNPDGTEDGNFVGKQVESPKHDLCNEAAK